MKNLQTIICFLIFSFVYGQDLSEQIDAYVSSYVDTGDFSGCILISDNGKTIYEDCFGYANHTFKIPNSEQTKFKIGSVSKQFTAAAILILEQDGLLKTSDTVSKFFPDHPNAKKITIHQLLTHTSGVTDIFNIPDFNKLSYQKINISKLSDMILESELDFEPDSRYQYSNGGYAVLATIIEKLSKTSYQQFLKDRIFNPLQMNDTGHNRVNEVVSNLSVGYDPSGYSNVKITDFIDPELLKGSGSLYSTTNDLQIWINSIKNKSLLAANSYEKLLNNYGRNYGYGISVYKSFDRKVFGHDGRINGYITDYLHYEEPDISIIILGNIQTGVADFFRRDIAAIVFDKDYKSRAKTLGLGDKSTIVPKDIIGTYAFGPNFNVYVEQNEDMILARANEGGSSELILMENGRFFSRTLYSYIEFVKNEEGEVTKMLWINNDGNSFEGQKK